MLITLHVQEMSNNFGWAQRPMKLISFSTSDRVKNAQIYFMCRSLVFWVKNEVVYSGVVHFLFF